MSCSTGSCGDVAAQRRKQLAAGASRWTRERNDRASRSGGGIVWHPARVVSRETFSVGSRARLNSAAVGRCRSASNGRQEWHFLYRRVACARPRKMCRAALNLASAQNGKINFSLQYFCKMLDAAENCCFNWSGFGMSQSVRGRVASSRILYRVHFISAYSRLQC